MANPSPQSSQSQDITTPSTQGDSNPIGAFAQLNALGFKDGMLLRQALTHPSYRNEHPEEPSDNERLEFLGDAVIDFIAAELLYLRFPEMHEGDLTRLRASIVRTESLSEIGMRIGVDGVLRMGKGEEANGGRGRANNICAAFEAVIGALYLDSGMDAARDFSLPLLIDRLEAVQAASLDRDARSELQERAQAELGHTPHYEVIAQSGPDHAKEWTVTVTIGSTVAGQGIGRSKQAASQAAARDALDKMQR
jgi:ribonuclease-3